MDRWVCPKCGKQFSKQQSLAGHMGHHSDVIRSNYVTREELNRRIDGLVNAIDKITKYVYDKLDDLDATVKMLVDDVYSK